MSKQRAEIIPLIAEYAFPNSLKVQRGDTGPYKKYESRIGEKYVRLVKSYFNWDELERTKEDGVERIIRASDERFAGGREANIRFIPRIAFQWPNHGDHMLATKIISNCARDMIPSTLDTPEFLARVRILIEKAGEAQGIKRARSGRRTYGGACRPLVSERTEGKIPVEDLGTKRI